MARVQGWNPAAHTGRCDALLQISGVWLHMLGPAHAASVLAWHGSQRTPQDIGESLSSAGEWVWTQC